MYVESGLGNYRRRRGLGAPLGYDEEGLPIENPDDTTYGTQSGGTYPPSSVQPFATRATSWLNQNSTMVAVGAGVFLVAILFAKAGR